MAELIRLTTVDPDGAICTYRRVVQDDSERDAFVRDIQFDRTKQLNLLERLPYRPWTDPAWPWINILERIR